MIKLLLISFSILILFCTGCGNNQNSSIESNQLIVNNGDRTLSFNKQPERLVTLRQHITETALELNLDNYIVGASKAIDPPVVKHLQERYAKLPIIAEKYPSPEVLFSYEPDIIWVDRKWAFVKNQLGSMENIERQGIKIYLSEAGFYDSSKIDYVYDDIYNMGKIFNNEQHANEIVQQMKIKVDNVQNQLGDIDKKVKVLDFDSGRNNMAFVGCRCMADNLITLAGGENIFQDIDKEWASVNWEEIMQRNPDVIIVHEYRGISGESKIEILKSNPLLQEVNAIKNNRFIIVNLDEIYEGSRNAETVEKLAKGFYPEKF